MPKNYELALIELYDNAISEATHQDVLKRFERAKENKVLLQELVKRATPMKVVDDFYCSKCGKKAIVVNEYEGCRENTSYCPHCGQAIDWSEEK